MYKTPLSLTHSSIIIDMWHSVCVILRLALSVTSYAAVLKASAEASHIKPLVKQLTDLRKMALSIEYLALLAIYIHTGRMVAAGYTVAFILLTSNISAIYDGIDNDVFSAHVEAIGPAAFTLINSLPVFIVQGLLCLEVVKISGSAVVGSFLMILVLSPGLLHISGNAISVYQSSYLDEDGPDDSTQHRLIFPLLGIDLPLCLYPSQVNRRM